jgi:hypothetical protein
MPITYDRGEPIGASREIAVAASALWDVVAQPGQLTRFHPFCRTSDVLRWPGPGSKDTVTYASGLHFERHFVGWYEGEGFDIEVGLAEKKSAFVQWRIEPMSAGECRLTISLCPYMKAGLSPEESQAFQQRYFADSILLYLDSVLRGVEQLACAGEPVVPDQFGRHPQYSA